VSGWIKTLPADQRTTYTHKQLALRLMTKPGVWRKVGTYSDRTGAARVASIVRTGSRPAWRRRPAGHFEAETRTTRTGHHAYARWVPREGQ